ncbi:MAG TPA: ferric reductase-like transmembrane domain-containing protein [Actinomycetes bacterium]|nr:ferric reductase-like transmembrane domain-containing protein [Actinomycetes bacterium]
MAGAHSITPAPLLAAVRVAAITTFVAVSAAISGWLIGTTVTGLAGNQNAPWILGRSAGITAYALLALLVATGLVLAHPFRTRITHPSTTTRIRLHIGMAVFTLAFTVLHVVVLATDDYAHVGWSGAFLPMQSEYRPLAVTLGILGLYAGVLAGVTASLASRWAARVWWPIHKVAAVAFVLVWVHGVLAGSDSAALLTVYLVSGAAILALAISRYVTRTPRDRVDELIGKGGLSAGQTSTLRAYQ